MVGEEGRKGSLEEILIAEPPPPPLPLLIDQKEGMQRDFDGIDSQGEGGACGAKVAGEERGTRVVAETRLIARFLIADCSIVHRSGG
jgi:hypothetical protein